MINQDYLSFLTFCHDYPIFFEISFNFLGSFGMCLGGRQRSSGATFFKISNFFRMVQKVSGKVQEGPWSPPDPIKNYLIYQEILHFCNLYFLLPIVLPIVLPIELPINRLGGRYVRLVFNFTISTFLRTHPSALTISGSSPKKIGFGPWGRFCVFFLSNKSWICLPY